MSGTRVRRVLLVACTLSVFVAAPAALAAPDGTVVVSQSLGTERVAPGGSVPVEVAVDVDDVDAPAIDVALPENWTLSVEDGDGARTGADGTAWLWTDGDDHAVEFVLGVPRNASIGEYELRATGSAIYDETGERVTDTTTDTLTVSGEPEMAPPTADAGANRTVGPAERVELNASDSADPVGDGLTYRWTQVGGPNVTLSDADTATPGFAAPETAEPRTLAFDLTVTDGANRTATDRVAVTIERRNRAPVADAGANRTAEPGAEIRLAGNGTDPDGDALSYGWEQVAGPTVSLSANDTAAPRFEVPEATGPTPLRFELTVGDGNATATDTVTVTAAGSPPTADAGASRSVEAGARVELDGTGSEAVVGPPAYAWTQSDGPSVSLGGDASPTPAFTAPSVSDRTAFTFELTVTDARNRTATDSTTVVVAPASDSGGDAGSDGDGGSSGDARGGSDDSDRGDRGSDGGDEPSGGSADGGDTDDADAPPREPRVSVSRPDGRSAVVGIAGATGEGRVEVAPNVTVGNLTYERVAFAPARTPATLRVAEPERASAENAGVRSLGTVTTDAGGESGVTLTVSVPASRLDAEDASLVTAYRQENGTAAAVNTTRLDGDDERYRYRVETAEAANLTIGVPRAALSVTDVRANRSTAAVGEPVGVTVEVANAGERAGNETVRLTGLGDERTRTLAVPAGGRAAATVVHRFSDPGTYTVGAGGENVTVDIESGTTETPATASGGATATADAVDRSTATAGESEPTAADGPGFGVPVALLAVVVAALLARRRT
ncbi:PKD domain-containing protein [Haloarcula nitratireducens]|uniref:PKD domain-containing protein n=1 Tax=Haloarcula nitratireducens TaxID=2487749 RepID=A0AAW4PBK1_9EURY|nr:PGF-CTERM sorting domain-containing protein [Halomicroarcula nitratireducens]MBX0294860.1 PKD domain-containing protein [Halomicroarcula nitratireducens]